MYRAPWGWWYASFDYGWQQAVCMDRFNIHHAVRYVGRKRKFRMEIEAKKKLKLWFINRKPGSRFRLQRKQKRYNKNVYNN